MSQRKCYSSLCCSGKCFSGYIYCMERYSQDTFPKNLNFEQRCSGACRMLFQDTFPRYLNFKSRCPRKCFSGYVHFTECCLEKLLPKVQANSREIQNMVILDRVIGRRLGKRTTVGRKLWKFSWWAGGRQSLPEGRSVAFVFV